MAAGARVATVSIRTVIAFAATFGATANGLGAADDLFDRLYARGQAQLSSMQSVRAQFTETTTSSLLTRPIVARGRLIAAQPSHLRMEYETPEPKIVVATAERLVVVWPRRGTREQLDITQIQKRVQQYFAHATAKQLKDQFTIRVFEDPQVRGTYQFDMRPKRKQIREGLEKLQLWLDESNLMLRQMRMTFPGGDDKLIALDDVEVNVPIEADTFRIP